MSEVSADQLINVLKNLVSAERDAELAEVFGLGKSTIASWRRRGVVPQAIIDRAKSEFGLTVEYANKLLRSEAETSHLLLGIGFYHAVLRLGATLNEEETFQFAGMLYRFDDDVRDFLKERASPHAASGGGDAIPTLSAVMDGRILGAEELRKMLSDAETKASAKKVPQ